MGAHDPENLILVFPQLVHKDPSKSPLTVVSMHHELCNPANGFAVVLPTASERLPCQFAVDMNACVGASLIG